jgi:predicted protein tyrosine phosphatase
MINIITPYRKLLVLSKSKAESFIHEQPWACISIHDSHDNPAKINKVQQVGILQLCFDDINQPCDDLKMFTEEQAIETLDFVKKVWDKVELLMIHCYAGICRSPAIAAMISKIYYGDDLHFYQHYTPNSWVYQTIYQVAAKRGDFFTGKTDHIMR